MRAIEKIENKDFNLTDVEIIELLSIDAYTNDFYRLLSVSNELTRNKFKNKGYVFTQVGINAAPCSVNCRFCSLGADHYSVDSKWEKDVDTLIKELKVLNEYHFDDFFLMTTADYSIDKYLEVSKQIKPLLKENQKFIANIGDFDIEIAKRLKSVGFTGVYHINRLREGQDTLVTTEQREKSIASAQAVGLEIYYCIEPIGPEHSYEELLEEIKRARDLKISVMAVMRRTPVVGTPLNELGQITAIEMTKIAAVTNIVVNPSRSMNVHEPTQMSLLAGVNQLYAELGANPRDCNSETEKSRGFTPLKAWEMLREAGYNK